MDLALGRCTGGCAGGGLTRRRANHEAGQRRDVFDLDSTTVSQGDSGLASGGSLYLYFVTSNSSVYAISARYQILRQKILGRDGPTKCSPSRTLSAPSRPILRCSEDTTRAL